MVTAYILIQTEVGKAAQVAKEIAEIKGVQQAEDVTGPYDVIVRAEARNVDDLGKLVVARVQAVDGITRTLTCPVVHLARRGAPPASPPRAYQPVHRPGQPVQVGRLDRREHGDAELVAAQLAVGLGVDDPVGPQRPRHGAAASTDGSRSTVATVWLRMAGSVTNGVA